MKTRYDTKNAEFSDNAHIAARALIYPNVLNVSADKLEFESTILGDSDKGNVMDGLMGIDRIVKISKFDNRLRGKIQLTIQERFRRVQFARYKDITITEWNYNSNLPSELYKISANYFVYGYFDENSGVFLDVITVNVPSMMSSICNGGLKYTISRNTKNQTFLVVSFDALHAARCVVYHQSKQIGRVYKQPALFQVSQL